ncbi:MAG TPA: GntR family transcriptional regulator [Nocardioides sp.]
MAHAWEMVTEDLTRAILSGAYEPGDLLPTVRELADRYDISVSTARDCIAALQRSGLVYSGYFDGKRGVRVRSQDRTDFVVTDELRPDRPSGRRGALQETDELSGHTPSVRFTMVMRVPPADVTKRLGLPPGTIVVERTTMHVFGGEAQSRERSWYPIDLAQETGLDTPNDIRQGEIGQLEAHGYAESAHVDSIIDSVASVDDAAALGVPVGSPLLVQTRTAATDERVTRVTETIRVGGRNRVIWEIGSSEGLAVIHRQLVLGEELAGKTAN